MKILIITNKLPYPPKDGGSIATFNLAWALADFASVDVLAINTSKHYFDVSKIPEHITRKLNFYAHFADTSINLFKLLKNLLFSKLPYNAERFILKDFEEKIIDLLQKNQYDIIQLEGLYVLPYIPTIRKYSKALVAYRAHNVEFFIWQRYAKQTKNLLKKIYLKNLTKRLKTFEISFLNTYDILVTISDNDKQILELLGNKTPTVTIPVGFDFSFLDNYLNTEVNFFSLFFIGALDWQPNIDGLKWFIKNCWPQISIAFPELKFYIAGRNASKQFVKFLRKYKNIIFEGEVPDSKAFMADKAIMIVPLFAGSGMRVKIIEAMAMGKTIVSTSIGAEGINCQPDKNIFIADTPNDFVDNLIYLLINTKKIQEVGLEAKIFVLNNFDNPKLAGKLFRFYCEQFNNSLLGC